LRRRPDGPRSGAAGFRGDPAGPGKEEAARAESYALDLLARRPRTVWELTERLRRRGFGEETISELVGRMRRIGYLDDRKFAEFWVQSRNRSRPSGPALIRYELRRKGLDPTLIGEVLEREIDLETEESLAVKALERKVAGKRRGEFDRAAERRLWSFLRRRGFGARACREALRAVLGPSEDLEPAAGDLVDEFFPSQAGDDPAGEGR